MAVPPDNSAVIAHYRRMALTVFDERAREALLAAADEYERHQTDISMFRHRPGKPVRLIFPKRKAASETGTQKAAQDVTSVKPDTWLIAIGYG